MKRYRTVLMLTALLLSRCVLATAEALAQPAPVPPTLDSLDSRRPLPLLPMMADHQKQNMRDHLVAVQEILAAVVSEDFEAVEKAAGRIGYSAPMGQMCTHMGAGAPDFTEQALKFHRTADSIAAAGQRHDRNEVLRALSTTLQACTACHAVWKQQVVDDATWSRLTSADGGGSEPPKSQGP